MAIIWRHTALAQRHQAIGEELEDIEYRGDWYDSDLYVKREIQVG